MLDRLFKKSVVTEAEVTAARLPTQLQGCAWAWPGLLSLRRASQQSTPLQRPSPAAAAPVTVKALPWPGLPASPPPTALTEPPSPCCFPSPLPLCSSCSTHPNPSTWGPRGISKLQGSLGLCMEPVLQEPPNPQAQIWRNVEVLLVGAGREVRRGVLEAG